MHLFSAILLISNYFSACSNLSFPFCVYRFVFTKRVILLIVGVIVAIAICVSTSLLGMKMADGKTFNLPDFKLESNPDFVFIIHGDVDRKAVVTKF